MRFPPLRATELRAKLAGSVDQLDLRLTVVERTGSTNADLLEAAKAGAPDRTVLVAERQDAGRGRLDRRWVSPPGAGLTFSVLLRPTEVPPARWGWLPLLAGLSLVRVIGALTSVPAALKWPNDLLLGPERAKGAGLLAEVVTGAEPAVVLGIGLNTHTRADELPEGATSLLVQGADIPRSDLLVALLRQLFADERAWRAAAGDPDRTGLRDGYRRACATIGSRVRIELPGGRSEEAVAVDVDADGRLRVADSPAGPTRVIAAGDVVHVRGAL